MSLKTMTMKSTARYLDKRAAHEKTELLRNAIENADAIVIGAGAGLSTSAGFAYSGERFQMYFSDFIGKYHFGNMYEGGFYAFGTLEEYWAYWSRYIYINRYMDAPKPVYEKLHKLIKDKEYFVLTTNVDHCFQKAGFAKEQLFYTQGDYGLFQCSKPCHDETYDNAETVKKMVLSQGFQINEDGKLFTPQDGSLKMAIPSHLIPKCPLCGKPMAMNLRADATFVQDKGWKLHAGYYEQFLYTHMGSKILFLELGVGYNTPGIIKYPFWKMTAENQNAAYFCINMGESAIPAEIKSQSTCMDDDISDVLRTL